MLFDYQYFEKMSIYIGAPDPVLNVRVSDRGKRYVKLRFTPQSDGEAPITNWIVESTNRLDHSWELQKNISDPTPSM